VACLGYSGRQQAGLQRRDARPKRQLALILLRRSARGTRSLHRALASAFLPSSSQHAAASMAWSDPRQTPAASLHHGPAAPASPPTDADCAGQTRRDSASSAFAPSVPAPRGAPSDRWLEHHPDQTGKQILIEFQSRYPGIYRGNHLRSLRRHVQVWRREAIQRLTLKPKEHTPALGVGVPLCAEDPDFGFLLGRDEEIGSLHTDAPSHAGNCTRLDDAKLSSFRRSNRDHIPWHDGMDKMERLITEKCVGLRNNCHSPGAHVRRIIFRAVSNE
jgi:hypothetical protein